MTSPRRAQPVEVVDVAARAPVEAIEVGRSNPLEGAELVGVGTRPPSTGGVAAHTHTQDTAADTWVVDHDLGHRPTAWSLFDADGRHRDEYVVELSTVNRVVVRMDIPTAGVFRCL